MAISLKPLDRSAVSSKLQNLPKRFSAIAKVSAQDDVFEEYVVFDKARAANARLKLIDISSLSEKRLNYYLGMLDLSMAVDHPNLVKVKEFWIDEGFLNIVVNEVSSTRIDVILEDDRFSLRRALEVATQLGELLSHLHEDKIYHGAICPRSVMVDKDYVVSVNPLFLDKLILEVYPELFRSENSTDYVSRDLLQLNDCLRQNDIHALGSMFLFMSTGYTDAMIRKSQWVRYGLESSLEESLGRAVQAEDCHYMTRVDEFLEALEDKHVEKFGSELSDCCLKSRMHRLRATQKLSSKTTVLNAMRSAENEQEVSSDGDHCDLFNKRYHLGECVEDSLSYRGFEAIDTFLQHRKVSMRLAEYDGTGDWSYDFRQLGQKLLVMKHPNISEVLDAGLLVESAYISSQAEPGERLREFCMRHNMTRSDISGFCLQMVDAIRLASLNGFNAYALSQDSIYVYGAPGGGYHYRMNCIGESQLLPLRPCEDEVYAWLSNSETTPPEMFDAKPKGFGTTQFILGNIIFRLLANGHPFEKKNPEEVDHFYKNGGAIRIETYRAGLPLEFSNWLNKLIHPDVNQRFETPELMQQSLFQAIAAGEMK